MTISNPTRAGLAYPSQILSALASPGVLSYEPDARGSAHVRRALGLPEQSLLAASTSELYGWLFKLLCNPGESILTPRPSYPLFDFLAQLEGVEVRQYPIHYAEGWWLDLDALEASIDASTRAIVYVHPNNPTGSFLKLSEWKRLTELCASRGLALISDEVFAAYPLIDDPYRAPTLGGNGVCLTFVLDGISKSAALPQMKAAWVSVSGTEADAALRRLELIADTYLSLSAPVLHALPELVHHGAAVRLQILERARGNLAALHSAGLRPLRVEGGWYAIIPAPRSHDEEDWAIGLLERHGILVQPGYFYDFESSGWLVLSLLTPPPLFTAGVAGIAEAYRAPPTGTTAL